MRGVHGAHIHKCGDKPTITYLPNTAMHRAHYTKRGKYMKAKVKVLKHENVSGSKDGRDYSLDFVHFLDLDNYDKMKLMVRGDELKTLQAAVGREGVLEVSVNPKTDRLEFSGFKVAA